MIEFNSKLDFEKNHGLIPAIVQDEKTSQVLMLGFMNPEALAKTLESGVVTFYSRTKERLWTKGETSGNFLKVVSLSTDCDQDSILIQANPEGPTCHLDRQSCFENTGPSTLSFLHELSETIHERKQKTAAQSSYTARLFAEGLDRIIQKVGEESIETVISAKNEDLDAFKGEAADLLYHLLVLFEAKGTSLHEVIQVLSKRSR